jgi:hypothetical protein
LAAKPPPFQILIECEIIHNFSKTHKELTTMIKSQRFQARDESQDLTQYTNRGKKDLMENQNKIKINREKKRV